MDSLTLKQVNTKPPIVTLEQMQAECVYITQEQMVSFVSNPKRVMRFREFAGLVEQESNVSYTSPAAKLMCEQISQNAEFWLKSEKLKKVSSLEEWALIKGLRIEKLKHGRVDLRKHDNLTHQKIIGQIKEQFREAMQAAGIHYSGKIIADDMPHYFHIEGQELGSLNGRYHLNACPGYVEPGGHIYRPNGRFADLKNRLYSDIWRYQPPSGKILGFDKSGRYFLYENY